MPPQEEQKPNRFWPEDSGILWKSLGILDLVFGAPSRAIQGGIISEMRGEDWVSGAWKSAIGQSLDTGEWGRGEIASGSELLEELGVIHDKDQFGNIVAGAGVDFVTDMASFNLIGAGRRVALSAVGKGPGLLRAAVPKGVRYRALLRDKFVTDQRQARHLKQIFLLNLDPAQQGDFISKVKDVYPQAKIGLKSFKSLVKKDGTINEAVLNHMVGQFDLERFNLRYIGPAHLLQKPFITPSVELMGHATGEIPEKAVVDIFKEVDQHAFRVVDGFELSKKHIGFNRPATFYDMRFKNAPRFFRDVIPANQPGPFRRGIELELTPPNWSSKAYHNFTKLFASISPFDFNAVLQRVGIAPPMIRAARRFTEAQFRDLGELEKMASKIGLQQGTKQAERLGQAADEIAGAILKTDAKEMGFIRERKALFDTKFREAAEATGDKKLKEFIDAGGLDDPTFYFHHKRTDLQEQVSQAFRIDTEKGLSLGLSDDLPSTLKVPQFLRRTEDTTQVNYDIVQEARAYITAINRKIHFEPAIRSILPDLEQLNRVGDLPLYWAGQDFVQMFIGNYGRMDGWFDSLARTIGLKGRNYATKLSVTANAATMYAMLGLNPRTTLLQLHQGVLNNTLHLGFADSLRGFFRHVTMSGGKWRKIYKESNLNNEVLQSLDREFARLFGHKGGKTFDVLDKILLVGIRGFDNFNRGWAFHGGVSLAKRAGLSDESAILQGIRAANETQFIYGKLGSSPLRRHPLGRLLFQFQSFAMKQLSFLSSKFRQEPGMNFLRYLALIGIITRNVGRNIDISSEMTPIQPGDVQNLLSMQRIPSLQWLRAGWDFAVAVDEENLNLLPGSQTIDREFAKEQFFRAAFLNLVPAGTMFNRFSKFTPTLAKAQELTTVEAALRDAGIFMGFEDEQRLEGPGIEPLGAMTHLLRAGAAGREKDKFGRFIRDLTPREAAMGIVGFRSTESTLEREDVNNLFFAENLIQRRYQQLMREAVRAYETGRSPAPFLREAQKLTRKRLGSVLQGFRTRIRNQRLPLRQRAMKRASRRTKMERMARRQGG